MTLDPTALSAVLTEWLTHQRWFAGKSRKGIPTARVLATLPSAQGDVTIWIIDVLYADGAVEHYQVALVAHAEARGNLEHAYVGVVPDTDGTMWHVYDALYDKDVTGLWLAGLIENASYPPLAFTRTVDADRIPADVQSLPMTQQQSNTSIVFGDAAIMKSYRRLEPGLNPDIEIHEALGRMGDRHTASMLGYLSAEVDGTRYDLAMVQEFLTTASDGWQLATASVRDLLAEEDLYAEEAGGDFAAEAYRLGVATAEVHADLAQSFGVTELLPAALDERVAQMNQRLDAALQEVPALADLEGHLRQTFEALKSAQSIPAQRIHGDLHLGQVVRTVHRWVFLDFEGEPAKSIADRRLIDSPLRDIAGMLRSFDYAARHQLADAGTTRQNDFRSDEWALRNRDAFCAGYTEVTHLDLSEWSAVLAAFEADKAVYETVYETRSRPGWLPIPIASLHRLVAAEA